MPRRKVYTYYYYYYYYYYYSYYYYTRHAFCPITRPGPSHWASLGYRFCGGRRQSPINVVTSRAKHFRRLTPFRFYYGRGQYMKIKNNGHTGEFTACWGGEEILRSEAYGRLLPEFRFSSQDTEPNEFYGSVSAIDPFLWDGQFFVLF